MVRGRLRGGPPNAVRATLRRSDQRFGGGRLATAVKGVTQTAHSDVGRTMSQTTTEIDFDSSNVESFKSAIEAAFAGPSKVASVLVGFKTRCDRSNLERLATAYGVQVSSKFGGLNIIIDRNEVSTEMWGRCLSDVQCFIVDACDNDNEADQLRTVHLNNVEGANLAAAYKRNVNELRRILRARAQAREAIREEGEASGK